MARALVKEIKDLKKNYLINGLMQFRQRYAGVISGAITASQTIKVHDRWITYLNNAGFFSSAAQGPTLITDPVDGVQRDALNFNANANNASANGFIVQRIESVYAKELAGKTASLSFLVRNDNFTGVAVRLYYANSTDNFGSQTLFHTSSTQTFTANNTVKPVKFENISIHANAVNGLAVEIVYSGFVLGVTADTAITKIMLNEGPSASPFQLFAREYGSELLECQRYYEKTYPLNFGPGSSHSSGQYFGYATDIAAGTSRFGLNIVFKTRKRATPAVSYYNWRAAFGANQISKYNADDNQSHNGGAGTSTVSETGVTGYLDCTANISSSTMWGTHWVAEAEL